MIVELIKIYNPDVKSYRLIQPQLLNIVRENNLNLTVNTTTGEPTMKAKDDKGEIHTICSGDEPPLQIIQKVKDFLERA